MSMYIQKQNTTDNREFKSQDPILMYNSTKKSIKETKEFINKIIEHMKRKCSLINILSCKNPGGYFSAIIPSNRKKDSTSSTITSLAVVIKSQCSLYHILSLNKDKFMLHYFLEKKNKDAFSTPPNYITDTTTQPVNGLDIEESN